MSYRNYATANSRIVDPSGNGDFATIATALTASVSGQTIFIRPGTYTESLTLKAGVNLTAFSGSGDTPNVTIIGKAQISAAGTVTISNIRLQTNTDFIMVIDGSAATIINLNNCYLNCSNSTGISFTTTNTSAKINIFYCKGNLGTTGISLASSSSTGALSFLYSYFTNTGASTTVTTASSGTLSFLYSGIFSPVSTTSTAVFGAIETNFDTTAQNATSLTVNGTGNGAVSSSQFNSGSASAISIGSGAALSTAFCIVVSSNTNAITGAGTHNFHGVNFSSSAKSNVTTQTGGVASGLTQGTAPSAGFVGEQIKSTVTGVSFSTNVNKNITSISLTAGIWNLTGCSWMQYSGTSNATQLCFNTVSATITGTQTDQLAQDNYTTAIPRNFVLTLPCFRVTLSATTTYYLNGNGVFSSGTCTGDGTITATRVG